ncbi:unnamed protein product [Linum trigynum]|uniref:Uncharacterized protein n=1 Tax=Linum trigynum TaxID=586398 RepID=A0AAV2G1A8_9ROSI
MILRSARIVGTNIAVIPPSRSNRSRRFAPRQKACMHALRQIMNTTLDNGVKIIMRRSMVWDIQYVHGTRMSHEDMRGSKTANLVKLISFIAKAIFVFLKVMYMIIYIHDLG